LIRDEVTAQRFGFDIAICMGHQGPHGPEDTGKTGKWTVGKLWKLRIVSRRQIDADLPDLHFDQMVVVDQPFRRGREFLAVATVNRQSLPGAQ
jgi:hypothetical protein